MMKINKKAVMLYAELGLLLTVACTLGGQTAQAQDTEHRRIPLSQEEQDRSREKFLLSLTAAADLHAGRYVQAEAEARESMSGNPLNGVGAEVLAAALNAQGKDQEALQQYRVVVQHYDTQPRNLLPYAQLLLKSGQWEQALAIYNKAMPRLPDVGLHPEAPVVHDGDVMRANSNFSADVPEPAALAVALHIARGQVYNSTSGWAGDSQDKEAMGEYAKALQLAPDNALTNYYYGIGWQKLSPTERTKFGTEQQAKAALLKAVKVGKGDVKAAAKRALLVAMKPQAEARPSVQASPSRL